VATERQFDRMVRDLLRQADREDAAKIGKAVDLIEDARAQIVARLDSAGEFETAYLKSLKAEVEALMGELERRMTGEIALTGDDLARSATMHVLQPFSLANVMISFPAIPTATIDVWETFTADLIKGVSQDAISKITQQINLAAVGAVKRSDAIAAIGRNLKDPSIFRSTKERAEVIYETELKRFRSEVKDIRFQEATEVIPELTKWWLTSQDGRVRSTHVTAGLTYSKENAIPIAESFIVGGYSAQYPRDWNLPAKESVRCRCEAIQKLPAEMFE
jgi:hypothetical protein